MWEKAKSYSFWLHTEQNQAKEKLEGARFQLKIKKNFPIFRAAWKWNRLPVKVTSEPSVAFQGEGNDHAL